MSFPNTLSGALLALAVSAPSEAATYTFEIFAFNAVVTESKDAPEAGVRLPAQGATGRVEVRINPLAIETRMPFPVVENRLPAEFLTLSAHFPGHPDFSVGTRDGVTAFTEDDGAILTTAPLEAFQIVGEITTPLRIFGPPCLFASCAVSASLFANAPSADEPNDLMQLASLLGDPDVTAHFSLSDDGFVGGDGVFLNAVLTPVPLPASGFLLAGALLLAGAVARRRGSR